MMIVAVSVFELHLPSARSLKDKRRVTKALIERIHHRYRVSITETDFHDLHQRSEIAVAVVHTSSDEMQKLLEGIRNLIEQIPEAILLSWDPQYFEGAP